ncbi:MAG: hypothetical protein JJ920_01155 [Roseitalea sp.]|nr:hypothetical protein [Roseitalea sp.]MBO6741488.1 hypothetical protein [Roseitalea sp.]
MATTQQPEKRTDALDLLRTGLAEAQATVRAYDTKAQIVGVGYIFALGIVSQINGLLPEPGEFGLPALLVAWLVIIFPIPLFGHVLYPTRKTAPGVGASEHNGFGHVLYLDASKRLLADAVRKSALDTDPLKAFSFELVAVSSLRELKRKRFLRGLYASALSFGFLFAAQVYRLI